MNPPIPKPLFNITDLTPELEANSQILVPNRRMARHITAAWGQHCHQQGQGAWRQPLVQSLDAWLLECWQQLQDRAYPDCFTQSIINSHAERLIWEQVIDDDSTKNSDVPIGVRGSGFARLAQTAMQNLERWRVPLTEVALSAHDASQLLLRWQKQFALRLANKKLLTSTQAEEYVYQAFIQGFLHKHTRLVLVGFNADPAPLFHDIFEAAFGQIVTFDKVGDLNKKACGQESRPNAVKRIHIAGNDNDEITRAAQWAKNAIDTQAGQRIGVVFPNLTNQRHVVDRIFREVFTPSYFLPASKHDVPPYNISAGLPLSDTPIVASALNLLRLQHSPQALAFYYQLLNDPFWGDTANQEIIKAQCQLLLRRGYKLQPSSSDLRYCMKRAESSLSESVLSEPVLSESVLSNMGHLSDPDNLSKINSLSDTGDLSDSNDLETTLSQALQRFEQRCRQQSLSSNPGKGPALSSFADWAEEFSIRLKILGWPGVRSLDSIEYQQQQLWFDVLEEFSGLDNAIDPVDASAALTQLTRICRGRIFQAEADDSPVQVLGLLEAAGLHFESLWLAEMHDAQWPQAPDYNPLLPVSLQRAYKLPRSSAETELTIARQLLTDFESHCQHLVFSYSSRDGDSERQVSRLLADNLPQLDDNPKPLIHSLLSEVNKPELQKIAIDLAPPLEKNSSVRGGSGVLRDQARCPFNAFAIWRLGADTLPEPAFGFTSMERGNLVHHILELFWAQCKDSRALKAMDEIERNKLLTQCISIALSQAKKDRPDLFGPRFSTIETQRLKSLLSTWLDVEQSRSTFAVVAREEKIDFQLGELKLSLRIDRIDQLEDGSVMLVDYKTGGASIKGFADERPEEPQLLLYALATDQTLAALCFAQVSANKGITMKGITSQPDLAPGPNITPKFSDLEAAGLEASWTETLAVWQQRLGGLAREFCEGDAEIAFYSNAAMNYQAHLLPLNRWYEIASDNDPESEPNPETILNAGSNAGTNDE